MKTWTCATSTVPRFTNPRGGPPDADDAYEEELSPVDGLPLSMVVTGLTR